MIAKRNTTLQLHLLINGIFSKVRLIVGGTCRFIIMFPICMELRVANDYEVINIYKHSSKLILFIYFNNLFIYFLIHVLSLDSMSICINNIQISITLLFLKNKYTSIVC